MVVDLAENSVEKLVVASDWTKAAQKAVSTVWQSEPTPAAKRDYQWVVKWVDSMDGQ